MHRFFDASVRVATLFIISTFLLSSCSSTSNSGALPENENVASEIDSNASSAQADANEISIEDGVEEVDDVSSSVVSTGAVGINNVTEESDSSALDESTETDPNIGSLPLSVQASLELLQTKLFHISWNSTPNAESYRVLENPDGVSGFTDISGELDGGSTNFDHSVALYLRVNAQYIVQSCNENGCADSSPVAVTGTLDNAIGFLQASNADIGDAFGVALSQSADGSTLAVGADGEDSATAGINGEQNDNSATDAGAVYIFVRHDRVWQQQAYIKASNTAEEFGRFGGALSLSMDGNSLAVGAAGENSAATGINGEQNDSSATAAGAAYIFARNDGLWQQQAYLKASNTDSFDSFGVAVSLSADGDTLAVGANGEDSAATGINGNQNDNSAEGSGAVYVFIRNAGIWQQQAYIKASNTETIDRFGRTLSLSGDGNTLAVGAFGEDSATTGINGDQNNNSANLSGAAYVFVRNSEAWQQQAYLKASNTLGGERFGSDISISTDGKTLAIGADGENSAARGINGNQNDNSSEASGAVYLFVGNGGVWQQQAYIKASNSDMFDNFGRAVSLDGDGNTLAVGAPGERSAASGINSDQNNNTAAQIGAVYVFVRNSEVWQQQAYVKSTNRQTGNIFRSGNAFGSDVSLSLDGNTLLVGEPGDRTTALRSGTVQLY